MSVARNTEITASSSVSFQDAMERGIAKASETLRNIRSAWVKEEKAIVEDGRITAYRVTMKVTFLLEE